MAIVPPPPVEPGPSYRRLDAAYGCFAFVAFAFCFIRILGLLPISEETRVEYTIFLGIPILFAALPVGIVGLVLAIVYRSHWQLGAMAVAAGIVFLPMWTGPEKIRIIAAISYALLIVAFCGRWFFFLRRKMKRAERA